MANEPRLQISSGGPEFNVVTDGNSVLLKDRELFYDKSGKCLFIGDGVTYLNNLLPLYGNEFTQIYNELSSHTNSIGTLQSSLSNLSTNVSGNTTNITKIIDGRQIVSKANTAISANSASSATSAIVANTAGLLNTSKDYTADSITKSGSTIIIRFNSSKSQAVENCISILRVKLSDYYCAFPIYWGSSHSLGTTCGFVILNGTNYDVHGIISPDGSGLKISLNVFNLSELDSISWTASNAHLHAIADCG